MTEDNKYSQAITFLTDQHRHRAKIREDFKKEAGDFLLAHELVLSGIASCLDRFGGRKWSDEIDEKKRLKIEQVSQLTALFLHGIDPCEVAIAEGLYGQAAALIRQHMEILAAIDEVWLERRKSGTNPKVCSLSKDIKEHYGGLSALTHAAVPEYLQRMHSDIKGDLVGSSIVPKFNKDMSLYLYRVELGLLFQFVLKQEEALEAAYDGEAFSDDELKLFSTAILAANRAAEAAGDLPKGGTDENKI